MIDTIKGEVRVYTKEVGERVIFNACVGATKTEDGYINYYMPVNFSKELKKDIAKVYKQESFDLLIKEAWIKAYRTKEEKVAPILFVNKATLVTNEGKTSKKATKTAKKAEEQDEDLPF